MKWIKLIFGRYGFIYRLFKYKILRPYYFLKYKWKAYRYFKKYGIPIEEGVRELGKYVQINERD